MTIALIIKRTGMRLTYRVVRVLRLVTEISLRNASIRENSQKNVRVGMRESYWVDM
jgi:hypothetical protein